MNHVSVWLNNLWHVVAVFTGLTALGYASHQYAKWSVRREETNLRRQEIQAGLVRLEHYANTGEAMR